MWAPSMPLVLRSSPASAATATIWLGLRVNRFHFLVSTISNGSNAAIFLVIGKPIKRTVQPGAAGCEKGSVECFLRVPQAAGLYCSCHAAQAANKGNCQKTLYKTFFTTCRPRLYRAAQNQGKQVLRISPIKFHFRII